VSSLRNTARSIAQQTIGRLPRSTTRLSGPLAINGGEPVRNVRYRPWPRHLAASPARWRAVASQFRQIYLSGAEGLPQTRQKQFAASWAEYCGCRHGLMLGHGTDALRLALAAAFEHDGLDYGGEVIVPNLSFIATATAALDRRFGVAFVDVEAGTLNLDPARVEAAIVPGKTRAIMPVHQFGQPANMTALGDIARRHGLVVIEDAAQAHGAEWESGRVGSLGHAAAFSFQSAKNLAAGEGGMLTTNDSELFERAFSMHNAGRSRAAESRWEHPFLGWNIRPTEYQAALLIERFSQFEGEQQRRAAAFARLRSLLSNVACVRAIEQPPAVRRHGMYMFVVRYLPDQCGLRPIDDFVAAVGAEGVPLIRCYSNTLSNQPAMQALLTKRPDYLRVLPTPVSDRATGEIAYLPSNVFLAGEAEMEDIAAALDKVGRSFAA